MFFKWVQYVISFFILMYCNSCVAQDFDLKHPEKYIHIYDVAFKQPHPKRLDVIDSIWNSFFTNKPDTKEDYNFRLTVRELAARKYKDEKCILMDKMRRLNFSQEFFSPVSQEVYEKNYNYFMQEAERLQFDEMKVSATFFYSIFLRDLYKKDALSLYYNNKCYQLLKESKNISPKVIGTTYYIMAEKCYKYSIYEQALFFSTKAQQYPIHPDFALFNINIAGMSCLQLKKYDSALYYFNMDIEHYINHFQGKDRYNGWIGILTGNKGIGFKKNKQYDSAIGNLKFAIEETYKHKLYDNTCGFATHLASLYIENGKINEAETYIKLAKATTKTWGSDNDNYNLHQLLVTYNKQKGNFKEALLHKDSLQFWADSINVRTGKNVQVQAELQLETEKKQNAEKNLENNIQNQKKIRIVLIVIFLLLTTIVIFISLRNKLAAKLKLQQAIAQQKEAEQKAILAEERLLKEKEMAQLKMEEFTHIITAKNVQIETLLATELVSNFSDEQISQLQKTVILTEEQWNDFKQLFDKVHPGFINKLKTLLPTISPAEIRLMALAKLKLSTKEMASCLGVSQNAVRNTWYRLRKKLNLSESAVLEEFVNDI